MNMGGYYSWTEPGRARSYSMPADFHLKAVASSIVRQNQAWRHIVGKGLPSKGSTCRSIDLSSELVHVDIVVYL